MIENYNETKSAELIDYKKYLGVASINVLCVNPDNAKLKSFGWNIADGAEEPKYVTTKERDGKMVSSTRIRLLVQIQDLEDKPIIPLDFWIGPDVCQSANGDKGKVIDNFGRTAWGTREEIKARKIPQYANGAANISPDYHMCHRGEEELTTFVFKYLNITPLQVFSRATNSYEDTKNPGKFSFDNWQRLCDGDVSELEGYFKLQPKNQVKVMLGLRSTEENRTYQTFINYRFLSNNSRPDKNSGDYPAAQSIIDKHHEQHQNSTDQFSASPVKEWVQTATAEIKDNSDKMFDNSGNFIGGDDDDLPMGW